MHEDPIPQKTVSLLAVYRSGILEHIFAFAEALGHDDTDSFMETKASGPKNWKVNGEWLVTWYWKPLPFEKFPP